MSDPMSKPPDARSWRVVGIHHVGVIVDDLAEAGGFLAKAFGLTVESSVTRENLRAEFFGCGNASIEMIEVTEASERAERLGMDARARIEHVAVEVDDLDAAVSELTAMGVGIAGPPRKVNTYRAVWTVPETTDGVIYQLVEPTE